MAESVVVADNVELVANNIQSKVGATLLGTKAMAKDTTNGSLAIKNGLEYVIDFSSQTVEKLTSILDLLKVHFGPKKPFAFTDLDPDGKPKKKKGPQSELQQLGTWLKEMDFGAMKGMGLAGGIAGLTSMLGKAIFSKTTALIMGLAWAIFDGFAGAKLWGGIPGFIGGFFGGLHKGVMGMAAGAGKWALIGAGLGSVVPGVGTMIGLIGGALFGGFLGWFGGEAITGWINNIIALPTAMMEKIVEVFTNIKNWVVSAVSGYVDWYVDLVKAIFEPITSTLRRIVNAVKSVINWIIDKAPGWLISEESKEKMKFIIEPEKEKDHEGKVLEKAESLAGKTEALETKVDKGTVGKDDVANTLVAGDEMLASMDSEELKKNTKYANYVMKTVHNSAMSLMKLAESGEVTEEESKALEAKAKELYAKLNEVSSKQTKVDKSGKMATDFGEAKLTSGTYDENAMQTELNDLNFKKLASEKIIADLEEKKKKGGLNQGDWGKITSEKKALELTNEDIAKINTQLASILKTQYNLEVDKITVEKPDIDQNKSAVIAAKQIELQKSTETAGTTTVTTVGGSPSINTNKNITTIASTGAFPVDASLMVALNGYRS